MLKLLLTFFMSFSIVSLASQPVHQEDFVELAYKHYESYQVITDTNNEEYSLTIIKGICNEKPSYGVYFQSHNDKIDLRLWKDSITYKLPSYDGYSYALAFEVDSVYYLELVSTDGSRKELNENLPIFTVTKYEKEAKAKIEGLNEGTQFTKLEITSQDSNFLLVLSIVMLGILIATIIILLILFILKKGFFGAKRKEGVLNVRELVKNLPQEESNDYIIPESEIKEEVIVTEKVVDVKQYLIDKGYTVDYKLASEEEKNQIMAELIKLKNENKISKDDYYEETIKLWEK